MLAGLVGEELEAYAELTMDTEQDHHDLTEPENEGEVAYSYQEGGVELDEAKMEQDCDEDSPEHWDEQIGRGSHSAVVLGTHGNQELIAGWVAVERAETAACAVAEEILEPSLRGVAEMWSTACEVPQVEHIATAKTMEAVEVWVKP